jgi:glyoxalase family protein
MTNISGIHHITAFAGSPRRTHDFYTQILGLRMIKKTVNFDDPFTYHLYFGDENGSPGTLLTHFPDARARNGTLGAGPEIADIALSTANLSSWRAHLRSNGVHFSDTQTFERESIAVADADGMRFQIVEEPRSDLVGYKAQGFDASPILGVSSVVLSVPSIEETALFLEQHLGFSRGRADKGSLELFISENAPGQRVIVRRSSFEHRVRMGAGSVHHVAWRVPDIEMQTRLRSALERGGVRVTPIIDRSYFNSIYFQIPGGLIFEVATDGPGFCTDESVTELGRSLQLPPQHEHLRSELERELEPLE